MQIKETIQNYGYTPTTLAKKMGVFDSTVSRIIKGNPTVEKLDELAREIGCQRWEFFLDEILGNDENVHQLLKEIESAGYKVLNANVEGHFETSLSEASLQVIDESRVLRFQYDCPQCGKPVKISIEKG